VVVWNADPRYASIIAGIPGHDVEDVRLSNIKIYYQGGGTAAQAALSPAERESSYPEPSMFGDTPAYGFFIRHVKGIELNSVEVSYVKDDQRPPFVLSDVQDASFINVRGQHAAGVPIFSLKNVADFNTQAAVMCRTRGERVDRKSY
jgi:hypothetical protein